MWNTSFTVNHMEELLQLKIHFTSDYFFTSGISQKNVFSTWIKSRAEKYFMCMVEIFIWPWLMIFVHYTQRNSPHCLLFGSNLILDEPSIPKWSKLHPVPIQNLLIDRLKLTIVSLSVPPLYDKHNWRCHILISHLFSQTYFQHQKNWQILAFKFWKRDAANFDLTLIVEYGTWSKVISTT